MHKNNCFTCGAELVYSDILKRAECVLCGNEYEINVACENGHYVCDSCHTMDAKDVINSVCSTTELDNPVALANHLMNMPSFKMHGPEHHILVPAVLVAAYCNAVGLQKERSSMVSTAIKRSSVIPGGFCGFQGACGAGIGTGVAISVITGANPVSTKSWSMANKMTANALNVIADNGGPRCCKRDVYISLLEASQYIQEHLGVALTTSDVKCRYNMLNKECRMEACLFYSIPV